MVLVKAAEKRNRQQQHGNQMAGQPGPVNALRQPRGGGSEVTTYVNDGGE